MKSNSLILSLLLLASHVYADRSAIRERVLDPNEPMEVAVGASSATTLIFPTEVDTIIGYGLTDGEAPGTFHYSHPEKSRLVVLRNIAPEKEAYMTVVSGESVFVFHLKSSDSPVLALKLLKQAPQVKRIEPSAIPSRRLDYSIDGLLNLLKISRSEGALRPHLPKVYENVKSRYDVKAKRFYDEVHTIIHSIHRFPDNDTFVFAAELRNQTGQTLTYDVSKLRIRVGNREYAPTLADASGKVEGGGAARVFLVLTGNAEGNRSNLSIDNDFRLLLGPTANASASHSINAKLEGAK